MPTIIEKLQTKRAALVEQIAAVDAAIKAEHKKAKEAAHREALALLHKSGVLDDPQRLRELIEKTVAKAAKDDHAQR